MAMMRQAEPATRLPSLFPEDKRAMEVRAREFFRRAATWPDLIRDVPELHHPTWHHRDFYWRQDTGACDRPARSPRTSRKSPGAAPPLQEAPRESNRLGPRARDRHRVGLASRGRHSPAAALQRARHSHRAEGRPWRPGLRAGTAVADTFPGRAVFPARLLGRHARPGCSPAIGRAAGRVPAAGRGPRRVPASAGAARGRAQAGTVRCLGPGIGRRRPERLSVEPPPWPGAVRRLSEPGHPGGPRSSGTGGLSAGADAPGRRWRRADPDTAQAAGF